MSRDLEDRLQSRGFPVRIDYQGGERLARATGSSYEILIGRSMSRGDSVETIVASNVNPRKCMVRKLSVDAYFYVQAAHSGSTLDEHERDCDALVDAFLVALLGWTVASKAGVTLSVSESRYLNSEEYNNAESFLGVVYKLQFSIMRAVLDKTYEGESRGIAQVQSVSTTASITQTGAPEETRETYG